MPVFYDLRKDIRFKQGLEEGFKQGEKKIEKFATRLLKEGVLSAEMIAEGLALPLDFVLKIQKELEKPTIKRVKKTP